MTTFRIDGELYSSKNSRNIIWSKTKRRYYLLKSEEAKENELDLVNKLSMIRDAFKKETRFCAKPLVIEFKIYRQTKRIFDYVNIIQNLLDCMVKADLIPDDNANELLPVFVPYEVDREHPRVEFKVRNKPEVLLFKTGVKCSNSEEVAKLQTPNFLALLEQAK